VTADIRRRPKGKGNERERSVSVVKLGTLRYATSTAKLTDSQQRDVRHLQPGQIVEFHRMAKGVIRSGVPEKRFKSGEQWEVLRREEEAVIVGKGGVEKQLPLDQPRKFSVFEREEIALAIGDRIRSRTPERWARTAEVQVTGSCRFTDKIGGVAFLLIFMALRSALVVTENFFSRRDS
jgi:hypothetical protein